MKKIIIVLSIILNVVSIVLILNLLGIPVYIKANCGMGWLMMTFAFFYIPIAILISILSYILIRVSKVKILKQLSLVILVLVILFELTYSILRIQVSNSNYICPESMQINYEEVL